MSQASQRTAGERDVVGARVAGVAALLHGVLPLVAVTLTREAVQPGRDDPAASVVRFYREGVVDVAFVAGSALTVIAFMLLLVFVAKVAGPTERRVGGDPWLSRLAMGAAVLDTAVVLTYVAVFATGIHLGSAGGSDEDALLLLHDLRFSLYWVTLLTVPLWMAPLGAVILHTRTFPRWLGWAMVGTSGILLVSVFLPSQVWDLVTGLPLLWVAVAGTLMLRHPERHPG